MTAKSQILTKDQILFRMTETRQHILSRVESLSPRRQDQVFLGIWSVKDVLAHLAGWDYTNLDAAKSVLAGKVPSFYDYRDHDWQSYNAILVNKYKGDSFKVLLTTVKNSQETLIAFLRTVPPEQFNQDFGVRFRGYKVTIQRLLEAEAQDEQTHLQQIRDFFKETQ